MKDTKLRGVAAAVTGALLFGCVPFALADSNDDLLKTLHDKGVLTDEEYDQFNAQRDTEKVKKNSEIKASFKDGISWQNSDGSTKIALSGRIQADYRNFNTPDTSNSGNTADTWDIRRAYLGAKGTFYNAINWELTTDLAANTTDGSKTNGYIKYAWVEAAWWEAAKVRFGQFKAPFGTEQLTSSRFIDFTERDWSASLAPGVNRGAMLHGSPIKGLTYGLGFMNGAFLADYGQNKNEANKTYDGKEYSARLTANFAQLLTIPDTILHAGVGYAKDKDLPSIPGSSTSSTGPSNLNFRTNGRGTTFFTTTGNYTNPEIDRVSLDSILSYKQFKFQSEWTSFELDPSSATNSRINDSKKIKAWWADLSWLITGESYADAYKDGLMDRIRPKNDFVAPGAPGIGAWEVGVRYSKFDAKDFNVCNGNAAACGTNNSLANTAVDYNYAASSNDVHSWTAGVKWIPNPNTRFMLDYIDTSFDHAITGGSTNAHPYDSEQALNFRAQFDF